MSSPQSSSTKTHRRPDRARKGASLVWINAQIIASSEQGAGLSGFLTTVATLMPEMNLVNLTTAIHRLGKLVAHDPRSQSQLRRCEVFADLRAATVVALTTYNANDIKPQSLSNILWALASIRYADMQIINLACSRALPNLGRFKPFELSTALWAVSKLSTIDSRVQLNQQPMSMFFEEAPKYVIQHSSTMEFRSLSMVAWAYATVKQVNVELFACIALQMTNTAHTATCQEMGSTVWAFGTLNFVEPALCAALAQKGMSELEQFKPQELSNMLWGFASSGFFHEPFFQRAAVAAKSKELSAQHLANILWAFSRVCPQHPLTERTFLSFLPVCCQRMESFKAQELSSLARSVATVFARVPGEEQVPLPSEVATFFDLIPKMAVAYDLAGFSTQSLTNMAGAIVMVGLCKSDALFPLFAQEAVRRAHSMQPAELLCLFQVFLTATPDGSYNEIASLMARTLADNLDGLRTRGVCSLSRTCIKYLGYKRSRDLNLRELRLLCSEVTEKLACVSDTSQQGQVQFNFMDFELDGTESTAQPSVVALSALSDPTVESREDSRPEDEVPFAADDPHMWPLQSSKATLRSSKAQIKRSFFGAGRDDMGAPPQRMQQLGQQPPSPTYRAPHRQGCAMSLASASTGYPGYGDAQSVASSSWMQHGPQSPPSSSWMPPVEIIPGTFQPANMCAGPVNMQQPMMTSVPVRRSKQMSPAQFETSQSLCGSSQSIPSVPSYSPLSPPASLCSRESSNLSPKAPQPQADFPSACCGSLLHQLLGPGNSAQEQPSYPDTFHQQQTSGGVEMPAVQWHPPERSNFDSANQFQGFRQSTNMERSANMGALTTDSSWGFRSPEFSSTEANCFPTRPPNFPCLEQQAFTRVSEVPGDLCAKRAQNVAEAVVQAQHALWCRQIGLAPAMTGDFQEEETQRETAPYASLPNEHIDDALGGYETDDGF